MIYWARSRFMLLKMIWFRNYTSIDFSWSTENESLSRKFHSTSKVRAIQDLTSVSWAIWKDSFPIESSQMRRCRAKKPHRIQLKNLSCFNVLSRFLPTGKTHLRFKLSDSDFGKRAKALASSYQLEYQPKSLLLPKNSSSLPLIFNNFFKNM